MIGLIGWIGYCLLFTIHFNPNAFLLTSGFLFPACYTLPALIGLEGAKLELRFIVIFLCRIHLKNRILAQGQGGTEFQPTDLLKYFEELKLGPNTEIETKDLFEMDSNKEEAIL